MPKVAVGDCAERGNCTKCDRRTYTVVEFRTRDIVLRVYVCDRHRENHSRPGTTDALIKLLRQIIYRSAMEEQHYRDWLDAQIRIGELEKRLREYGIDSDTAACG